MKTFLYIMVSLLAVVVIIGIIAPSKYAVERQIVINKPKTEVFDYLKSLKNQDDWSVWSKRDPNIKKTYRGEDRTVGFVSAWEGNDEVGKGEQEIIKITPGERIDLDLRFEKPFESTNPTYLITESISDNQTKVRWGFSGESPFPLNVMLLFMNMEESIGKDFDEGLSNLKNIVEKQ
jgi:hypothetical protein